MLFDAWTLLCQSALFVLIGFGIAGILHVVLSADVLLDRLRGRNVGSVIWATLVGAPLPLCSCSVLPTAVTLRRKGASPGATMSFLVSTPETSITSVLLTYGLLGPVFAVVRPVAACITAIVAGIAGNAVDRGTAPPVQVSASDVTCSNCGCGASDDTDDSIVHTHDHGASTSSDSIPARVRRGFRFAFVELFDDIFGWILIGVLAAAAIRAWIPPETLLDILGGPFQSMLVMVLIGVPLYVCAEASTPVAAALIAQGVSPGAALVFLLVGPATNLGSLGVLRAVLGTRLVTVYLLAIILVAVGVGMLLDLGVGSLSVPVTLERLDHHTGPNPLETAAGVLFLLLGVATLKRRRYLPRLIARLRRPRTARAANP